MIFFRSYANPCILQDSSIALITIDSSICTSEQLTTLIEDKLGLPYSGGNWDGFGDSMTEWGVNSRLPSIRKLCIFHEELPHMEPRDLYLYLSIIDEACNFWDNFDYISHCAIKKYEKSGITIPADCWVYNKKEMDVYFNEKDRRIINRIIVEARKEFDFNDKTGLYSRNMF